jgi:RNA polymerase sigma factor (sigma-70 family)
MPPAESALLARACEGDHDALAALVQAHDPAVRAAIQRRFPQRWQALLSVDDVLQETYVDALLAIRRFRPASDRAFGAWLRKLAEHNLIEVIRALETSKRDGQVRRNHAAAHGDSVDSLYSELARGVASGSPSRHLARADRDRVLNQALERLPEDYRKIVRQYDLNGRPMHAIAAEIGRSVGAVHLMRVRALARLRLVLNANLTDFQSLP